MIELIKFIVESFAEVPEKIDYEITENGAHIDVVITLDPSDMGKVIGKQGKIAKAIRAIMKSSGNADKKRVMVEIQ